MTYPHKLWCQRNETPGSEKRDLVTLGRQVERYWPVLEVLEEPAFLTADHVGLLLYPGMQKATKVASGKLHRLFELGLVNAFRFSRSGVAEGPGGSAPLIYHLSKDGAGLLAARKEVSIGDLLWHERQELLSTAGVCHRLDLADLHCALVAHCTRQGMTLKRFAYEPRIELPKVEGSEVREVWPDGLVDIQGPGQELALLIEVDRDTERPRRFAERVNRYEALWRSGAWEEVLPAAPTVLVVVTDGGRSRMEALREATAATLHKTEAKFKRYRFAVMEDLYRVERSSKGYTARVMTAFDKAVCVKPLTNDLVPLLGGGGE